MALLLLPSFPLETWILALGFLALFLLYGIWPYSFFKNLGIPGPRPLPFIGTFHKYSKGIVHFDQSCYQKYGKIWGIFDGRQPVMAILDPTIIKTILVKEFYTNFTNHRDFILNGDLDTAITIAPNEQWKRIRTVLSPTFTSGRLKEMLPIINRYGEMLVKNVQKKVDNGKPIAMKEIFSAYSMDVVTSTSFSINIDSMNSPNDPLVVHIKRLVRFNFLSPVLILAALFPLLTPVLNMLNISIMPPSLVNFLFDVVKKIKEHRQKNDHMHRADFLQLMLDSQISGDTSDEANSLTAGYKTKGSTLSFLSYCLATHPDVQQKLQEEIDEALPNQLEYLDMVVNETLRLYPPGGRIERVCKNTIEINGVTIPKGTVTMIPAFVLHHDPEYWPEPKEYRPERFSKESREAIDPYVFLPFGAGPRNCIGMHFALLVLKVAVVVLLQKFSFRPCKETQIPMELDSKGFFMQPKKPIKVKLVPRGIADSKE